ncbi:hypothetical protein [Phormidesmis priestleyi]|nr:hypothetical protein [Phormidesmis priestleyi]
MPKDAPQQEYRLDVTFPAFSAKSRVVGRNIEWISPNAFVS